ncbi:hypothetical protein [Symbiopectobacterium purcellii]|uniref:Uncharacterized protein n=1 Tax=Symbiopectobacterium purcellii TaxID=2871826 RepID=A0ABX9AG30_9ENTR|nr:hypothetical protein [Symbiopectobacterium purcellii]QZN94105.1 hypothetical protein K6K13_11935 [Symbiopectobacterium purcellii]
MILAGLALKINRKLIYVATITLLLNFSSVGIIVFLVVMGSLFFEKIRLYKIALSVVLIFLFIVINYEFIINFTTDFFNKFESTAGSRFKLIDYVLFDRHGYINIFGVGYFNIPKELYMEINSGAYSMAAINDAGLISFILLKFGLISLPFVYWIFKNVNGRVSKIVFTGVLLTKISFLFPILYIGLLPAIFKGRNTAR